VNINILKREKLILAKINFNLFNLFKKDEN